MKIRFLYTLLFALSLSGCSNTAEQPSVAEVNNAPSKEKTAHTESALSIFPADATVQSVISVTSQSSLLDRGEVFWYVNGSQSSVTGMRFSSPNLRKGDSVQAVVRNNSKELYSNKVIIKNTPPAVSRAALVPANPRTDSTLSVDVMVNDIDNDTIQFTYKWQLNGRHVSDEATFATDLKRDDSISVEVTPHDGEDSGKSIILKSKIHNSLPVVTSNEPVFDGTVYRYTISAIDPDGDTITYALRDAPEGMTIDSKIGAITWEVKPEDLGLYDFKVSVKDDHGGEIIIPVTTNLVVSEQS